MARETKIEPGIDAWITTTRELPTKRNNGPWPLYSQALDKKIMKVLLEENLHILLAFPGCSARLQIFEREIINAGVKSYEYIWQISMTKMGYDMRYNPAFETITSDRFPSFVEGFRAAVSKYNEMLESDIPCKSSDYTHANPAIRVTKLLPQMIKKYPHSDELIEYQPKCISMRMTSSTNNTFSADYNISEAEALIKELEKVPQMVDVMIKKMKLLRAEFPDD